MPRRHIHREAYKKTHRKEEFKKRHIENTGAQRNAKKENSSKYIKTYVWKFTQLTIWSNLKIKTATCGYMMPWN